MLSVAFRLDASHRTGAGHLMRCLTLADELKARGANTSFLCNPLASAFAERVQAAGHRYLPLEALSSAVESAPLNPDQAWLPDAIACKESLSASGVLDWMVVDHYGLDSRWEREMRAVSRNILSIDDLANRAHDCDVLLDQNFNEQAQTRYVGLVSDSTCQLLGPTYALVRPEFRRTANDLESAQRGPFRVLVNFGGSDPTGETSKVLREAARGGAEDISFDVVVGAANEMAAQVEAICRDLPAARFLFDTKDMAGLMRRSDIFLGAGGTTTWERYCIGLPGIVVATAGNQEGGARALARHGGQLYLGSAQHVSGEEMLSAVRVLKAAPDLLQSFRQKGLHLVDGRGTQRVVNLMDVPAISVRLAQVEDAKQVYTWRNDPAVRRHSFIQDALELESHLAWFEAALQDSERVLLIVEMNGQECGVLRYDLNGSKATVSIYLAPWIMGRGFGQLLLKQGSRWMSEQYPDVNEIEAEVMPANKPSVSVFEKSGFELQRYIFRKSQPHVH